MKSCLVGKLISVLKSGVFDKLNRYDEGTMIGNFMTALVKTCHQWSWKYLAKLMMLWLYLQNKNNLTGSGSDLGKSYMAFCRVNMDQIEKKIKDDLWVLSTMEVIIHFQLDILFNSWFTVLKIMVLSFYLIFYYFRGGMQNKYKCSVLGSLTG